MRCNRLTEGDVIVANMTLVNAACSRGGRMLEPDDRMQSALLGLLYAIRTYRNGSFPDYALRCMKQFIREAERELREARRAEAALSLDMRMSYDGDNPFTYLDMCVAAGDDYALFDLVDAVKAFALDQPTGCGSAGTTTEHIVRWIER